MIFFDRRVKKVDLTRFPSNEKYFFLAMNIPNIFNELFKKIIISFS